MRFPHGNAMIGTLMAGSVTLIKNAVLPFDEEVPELYRLSPFQYPVTAVGSQWVITVNSKAKTGQIFMLQGSVASPKIVFEEPE